MILITSSNTTAVLPVNGPCCLLDTSHHKCQFTGQQWNVMSLSSNEANAWWGYGNEVLKSNPHYPWGTTINYGL